jgi:hypothetical protein
MDAVGFLDAPAGQLDATPESFLGWSQRYVLSFLQTVEKEPITASDLYSARCGILHVSGPVSRLAREGKARVIWYQFKASSGAHLKLKEREMPLLVEIEALENAFRDGSSRYLSDLRTDQVRFDRAIARTEQFLVWGVGSILSDEEIKKLVAQRSKR